MSPEEKVLLIPKIENGFVIDHIPAGAGGRLLHLMQRHREFDNVLITLGQHYSSRRLGRKDLLKIQANELPSRFLQHLALLMPGVTVKRIRDFKVAEKVVMETPDLVHEILRCPNPNCITNHERGMGTTFHLVERETKTFRCNHCERHFTQTALTATLNI
ncbi:MAG: Aspartate carbamoyltransferase regulatory chain (PyrI) [Candidatus Ozemobacter sibiricus]|jgi:aspartate carbamoyltransferase regulatory subunit|uniref:Aspartate carbamoyltransferase regulatory chain n=1 Tax=Candidatus Ozemobacter sibiricus TaxID=2268124 RepID=A0A367ZJJ7_9BACT|nr:MAG: Aspartate carbamoyltransferase regulatory chain (PyrI) [Candidatus Ozemobacter sibiricus]